MSGCTDQTRGWLVIASYTNVAVAVIAAGLLWWQTGYTQWYIVGTYGSLDDAGVIEQEALREYLGDRFADDWFLVPTRYLVGDEILKTRWIGYGVASMFAVNAVGLFALSRRLRSATVISDGQIAPQQAGIQQPSQASRNRRSAMPEEGETPSSGTSFPGGG